MAIENSCSFFIADIFDSLNNNDSKGGGIVIQRTIMAQTNQSRNQNNSSGGKMKNNIYKPLKRSLAILLTLVMLLSVISMSALAENDMTIKVTANLDRENNPTIISAYSRAAKYFTAHTNYPVNFVKTEGGYDIYTTSGLGFVEAYIPGVTDKVVKPIAGSEITLDLPNLSSWVSNRYAADMYTNLGDDGTLNLTSGEIFNLDTFRVWQALGGSVTENNFVEPGFCFDVFGDNITTERIGGPGREQLKITALSAGVAVIKITYGAVTYNGYSYSAIDPRNTYAVVVNVDGGEVFDTGINTPGGVTARNDFDTFYFDNTNTSLDFTFTPASGSTVSIHSPLNSSAWCSGWSNGVENNDGSWTVSLTDGRNIIKISNGDSTRYHLVKARGIKVTVSNLSTPGSAIGIGETARITINGIESPVEKMSGIYNPGFSQAPYLQYISGMAVVKSDRSGQYDPLLKTFTIDYTLYDAAENVLNGQIQGGGGFWGIGMDFGYHRIIPIDGVIGSSSGGAPPMGETFFGALPEITLTVDDSRSAVSPFTADGWLIIEAPNGTNSSNNLTQKLRDIVGANNLDTIKRLKITGEMSNTDYYNGTMTSGKGALFGGNSTATAVAALSELIELDLSGVISAFPNQALRGITTLEKLRLPADLVTSNHSLYYLPALTTIALGDAPYIDSVVDLTGFTGEALQSNLFGRYICDSGVSAITKVVIPGALDVPTNGFLGLKDLQEIVFTGDTLGAIGSTAFSPLIKDTAVAYVPDEADTTTLENWIVDIRPISSYKSDEGLVDARLALSDTASTASSEYGTANPGYSDQSWNTLQKAIKDAYTLISYDDYMLTAAALSVAGEAINDAIMFLTPDKEQLKKAISEANEYVESDWTAESWDVFSNALENAKAVYYDSAAMLGEITSALANLSAAVSCLQEPLGNTDWLNNQIAKYGSTFKSDFTANSNWESFSAALEQAKAIVAADAPTAKQVNAVEEILNAALSSIVFIGDLRYEINNAKSLSQSSYTANTWAALAAALTSADVIFSNASASQAEVDASTFALHRAVLSLESSGSAGPVNPPSVTVTFRLIGDTQHEDFDAHGKYVTWMATKSYTFNNTSRITVYDIFTRALDDARLAYKGAENNYVNSIQAPTALGGYWLAEFENGSNSGWMYTVNGTHPGRGLVEHNLCNGDVIIWHYVDDYTRETSFEGSIPDYPNRWLEAEDVDPVATGPGAPGPDGTGGSGTPGAANGTSLDDESTPLASRPWTDSFADVKSGDWYYAAVKYAYENELMNGTSDTRFAPALNLSRAMLVTILYRYEGMPEIAGSSRFTDVPSGQWYSDAIAWADENSIVSGYGDGRFGTNDDITREQLAVILYNYAKLKGLDLSETVDLAAYDDTGAISYWALDAMKWANATGLINGRNVTNLAPLGTTTRAEAATVLMRFIEDFINK